MSQIKNTFQKGRMNQDFDSRFIPNGEYRDALNIKVSGSSSDDVGAVENNLSNKILSNIIFNANPRTIGMYMDTVEEKIYWFVVDDTASYILEYDTASGITSFVLNDTSAGVLNFDRYHLITGINLIVNTDNNDRLLCWTDNLNPPRQINIDRAKAYGTDNFNNADISLIKSPPLSPPEINLSDTIGGTGEENNIEERFMRFGHRYEYLDGEFSAPSPFSEIAFLPGLSSYNFATQTNDAMVNAFNQVNIAFSTGSSLIKSIDILFKDSNSNTIWIIDNYKKDEQGWGDNQQVNIDFNNNKLFKALSENELFRLFDAVPLKAKAQELIGNRLIFGNYTENYNLGVVIDFTASGQSDVVNIGTPSRSLKSNRDYEIGIVYVDLQGRMTTVLTSDKNTVFFPNSEASSQNRFLIEINNLAPEFAVMYRFFVKQTRTDYDTLNPSIFYNDGVYVWILLQGNEASKLGDQEYIYVKQDTQNLLPTAVQTRVLEVVTQLEDFLDNGEFQVAGQYFKVNPKGYQLNESDYTVYEFSSYDSSSNNNDNPVRELFATIEKSVYYPTGNTELNDAVGFGTYTGNKDLRYSIVIDSLGAFATATATCTSVIVGNTLTANGLTYTAVAGVKADDTEFSIDTDDTACALDLADSITNDTRTGTSFDTTAVSAVNVVTITTTVPGTSGNLVTISETGGTIALSGALFSGGVNDTFQWNDGDTGGDTFVDIIVSGQELSNGLGVSWELGGGHTLFDRWVISGKAEAPDGLGTDGGSRAYAFFKSIPAGGQVNINDTITAGSQVILNYHEYEDENVDDVSTYIVGANYDNLEEWWEEEGIGDNYFRDNANVWWRRGTLTQNGGAKYFTQTTTGDMVFIVRSVGNQASDLDKRVKIDSVIQILTLEKTVIFETKPKNFNTDIFFEIGRTYPISPERFHLGFDVATDTDQTGSNPALLLMETFNCYTWGNGFESYKIRDLFNATNFKFDTRPLSTIEDYRENVRIASLTYGGVYEQSTNFNGLNVFNLATSNFKDLDDKYESIQKLHSRDTDIIVFQEDKVHKVPYLKNILFTASGDGNVTETTDVLGTEIAYVANFGISKNPESFASYKNSLYFTDVIRSIVCRLDLNGIIEISKYGMDDFFEDSFRALPNTKKVGSFDLYAKQYVLSVDDSLIPQNILTVKTGTEISKLEQAANVDFKYIFDASTGDIEINFNVTGTINLTVTEDTVDTDLGNITGSGSILYSQNNATTELIFLAEAISLLPSYTIDVPTPVDVAVTVVANADVAIVNQGEFFDVNVLNNDVFSDIDNITVTIEIPPTKGTAVVNANKTIRYTNDGVNNDDDNFDYKIDDGLTNDVAKVDIGTRVPPAPGTAIEFNISSLSFFNTEDEGEGACPITIDNIKWHNGDNSLPVLGDVIFNDVDLLIPTNGFNNWWKIDEGRTILIRSDGGVKLTWICGIGLG